MTKKKILLVSYLFAPNNRIGAIRPTKIAEGLIREGYTVDVFTYGYTDNDSLPEENCYSRKYVVNNKVVAQKKINASAGKKKKDGFFIHKLKRHYFTYLSRKRDKVFLKKFKKIYAGELVENQYDVVISSYGPLASLEAGLYVKKKNPEIVWLCDFRDPVVVADAPEFYLPYFKYIQNKACQTADKIIAVSNGYLDRICKGKYTNKAVMIPNGYDLKDKPESVACGESGKLNLSYVGAMYAGKRDLSPMFRAIRELVDEGVVDKSKIVFNYAGTEFFIVQGQARTYDMESVLCDCGLLSRADCLALQMSSHALVLSTWNDKNEYGVFPGKFLEYMLMEKPVISVVDGNLGDSEVTQVIEEGRLGVSFESASAEKDFVKLKTYIGKLYTDVVNGNGIEFLPDKQLLNRYNYKNIIEKITELIEQ